MCADFQFFLNRQGPRGPQGYKGDKGADGKTPAPRTGTNTPIETTVIFDTGDGNPYETPNLKYPIQDRGGNMVMLDRANSTQYYGTPDQATDNSYGVVKLATSESVLDDPLDNDVVTYELFDDNNQTIKTTTDSLAGDITQLNTDLGAEVTNRTNADTQLTNKINTDVGNEATARSNADAALSGRIDSLNSSKANKSEVYTKTQTDSLLSNKSNVGHTHNYNDLTNKPDIGNGTITFRQGNTTVGTITTNQLTNSTLTFADPTGITPGTGLDLDTSTNTLSVKIDNDTLGINSDGKIEVQNAGTTYSEGNAIDLTNDTISVKYDNSTLKLNGSGELYADIPGAATSSTLGLVQPDGTTIAVDANGIISANIPTPETVDQTYDGTSTHAQSGVAIAGAGFLNGGIVRSPLEYLPDTTDSITLHNMDSNYSGIVVDDPYVTFEPEVGDVQPYFEINLLNGINIVTSVALQPFLSGYVSGLRGYTKIIKLGYYDEGVFIPICMVYPVNGYNSSTLKMFTGNKNSYSIGYGTMRNYKFVSYDNISGVFALFSCSNANGEGSWGSKTIVSEEDKLELNKVTIARFTGVVEDSSLAVGNTVYYNVDTNGSTVTPNVYNPSKDTYPFYSLNNASNDTITLLGTFISDNNKDNLLEGVHPASLSLKYDSTTLGVNANNELYALSSTPSNMVTTDTQQIITGRKDMAIINMQPSGSTGYLNYITPISSGRIAISKVTNYDTAVYMPGIILDYSSGSAITAAASGGSPSRINLCTEYGNNTAEIRFCNGFPAGGAGNSHSGIGKYGNYTYIRNNNANDKKVYKITGSESSTSSYTNFFLESDMLDGTTIQYNSTSGKVEALGSQQEGVLPVSDDVIEIYTTNYTIIGNPTITSDHVFSTTSGSDSLTSVVPFRSAAAATAHSLKFECQFRPTASSHSNGEGIFCRDSSSDGIRISLNASACVRFRTTINSSGVLDVTFSNTPLVQNTLYKLTAEIAAGASSGTGTLYTSTDNGITWTTAETVTLGTNTPLAIGSGASSLHYFGVNTPGPTLPFGGEILLDKMYLEEDGVVIWTPVVVTGNMTEIGKASENTYGLVKIDGIYLKYDSATGCVTLDIQAIKDAIDALT